MTALTWLSVAAFLSPWISVQILHAVTVLPQDLSVQNLFSQVIRCDIICFKEGLQECLSNLLIVTFTTDAHVPEWTSVQGTSADPSVFP